MGLDFFLNAAPVGKFKSYVSNVDYRISVVRYFGNGEEEADYSGQPTPNIEIDGWGMFIWGARVYLDASNDLAWLDSTTKLGPKVYDAIVQGVAQPLEANLEPNGIAKADSSIWEVHDANKKHFAYTTLATARGFCDMAGMSAKAQKGDPAKWRTLAKKVQAAFLGAFVDSQGSLGGSLEEIQQNRADDAAVVEAFTWNILPDWKGNTATKTLQMFDRLRVSSGGFKRNDDGLSSYDNNEWILVDLRISNALRRAGKSAEADGYLNMIVDKAQHNFLLVPELYNAVAADGQIGKYIGSIPMVGYGSGAYIITVLDRSGAIEPNDCGDGMGATLPAYTCAGGTGDGGVGPGGDGGIGGGGDGGMKDIPFVPACYCEMGRRKQAQSGGLAVLFGLPVLLALCLRRCR
jgi:GH15 family glucan-1,4-alpha-glucosidase